MSLRLLEGGMCEWNGEICRDWQAVRSVRGKEYWQAVNHFERSRIPEKWRAEWQAWNKRNEKHWMRGGLSANRKERYAEGLDLAPVLGKVMGIKGKRGERERTLAGREWRNQPVRAWVLSVRARERRAFERMWTFIVDRPMSLRLKHWGIGNEDMAPPSDMLRDRIVWDAMKSDQLDYLGGEKYFSEAVGEVLRDFDALGVRGKDATHYIHHRDVLVWPSMVQVGGKGVVRFGATWGVASGGQDVNVKGAERCSLAWAGRERVVLTVWGKAEKETRKRSGSGRRRIRGALGRALADCEDDVKGVLRTILQYENEARRETILGVLGGKNVVKEVIGDWECV